MFIIIFLSTQLGSEAFLQNLSGAKKGRCGGVGEG